MRPASLVPSSTGGRFLETSHEPSQEEADKLMVLKTFKCPSSSLSSVLQTELNIRTHLTVKRDVSSTVPLNALVSTAWIIGPRPLTSAMAGAMASAVRPLGLCKIHVMQKMKPRKEDVLVIIVLMKCTVCQA
ncbi:uncharacterized protein V6R79_003821 [Siganus canaliculatus]